jgi:hypothetical protein
MELVNWIFFGPAKIITIWPYAGILIGTVLIAVQVWLTRRKGGAMDRELFRQAPVLAGLLWVIFNLYELQVVAILAKNSAGGTLRIDLVILVPILYVLSVAAILSIRAQLQNTRT